MTNEFRSSVDYYDAISHCLIRGPNKDQSIGRSSLCSPLSILALNYAQESITTGLRSVIVI